MPVVGAEWMRPGRWLKPRTVWCVVRDGESLRFCRQQGGKITDREVVAISGWGTSHQVAEKIQRDQRRNGCLIAGIPPGRILLRPLTSPLKDRKKAKDIWPTLFDAAVPFPLESCVVAFVDLGVMPEGTACLAAAMRKRDQEALRGEWSDLGLEPDLWVPETLAVASDRCPRVWRGESRSVWSLWRQGVFLGAGGADESGSDLPTLRRQCMALGVADVPPDCGPGSDNDEPGLEERLVGAVEKTESLAIHIGTAAEATSRVTRRWEHSGRSLRGMGMFGIMLLIMLPFFLPHLVWMRSQQDVLRIEELYTELTGKENQPAPGQAARLAQQFVDATREGVQAVVEDQQLPRVTPILAGLLASAEQASVRFDSIELTEDRLQALVRGDAEAVAAWAASLEEAGWQVDILDESRRVEGRRQ